MDGCTIEISSKGLFLSFMSFVDFGVDNVEVRYN